MKYQTHILDIMILTDYTNLKIMDYELAAT